MTPIPTPRTDAAYDKLCHFTDEDGAIEACAGMRDFARDLERELAQRDALTRRLFYHLDTVEESDLGREFHPVHLSCCRAAWTEDLNAVLAEMKRLAMETKP